ncbi:MAG: type II secretion system major pseudopilin GspG [Anaerohalosphaera sp.]|nr:type II secretion system major pseudopilin GspG [Anaerohalosphaera sp.]
MNHKARKRNRKAFTMVELVAILVILGLLAAAAMTSFVGTIDKAKVATTRASLKMLHNAVVRFKMDTGVFPTEEVGLMELIEEPSDVTGWDRSGYLETTDLPNDGWGHAFIYQVEPGNGKPFAIISYGADDEPDGEDLNADIYSTDAF